VAGVTAALVASAALSASAHENGQQEPGMAASFLAQINASRESNHRPRLATSSELTAVAAGWAETMASANVLAEDPHLATSVSDWHYLGENVGVGYSVASLESALWSSSPHRANMLSLDYTQVGVAVVDVGGKLWVAEEYSRPNGASATSTGSHARPIIRRLSRVARHPSKAAERRWASLLRSEELYWARNEDKVDQLNSGTVADTQVDQLLPVGATPPAPSGPFDLSVLAANAPGNIGLSLARVRHN
jgi:hypothetical protein